MASYQRTDVGDVESKPKAKSTPKSGLGQNPLFEISWRLALVVSFGASLAVVLYMFQQKGRLSSDERRWFNALTLLFTALISLSVGSLLGLLGTMIRWPLLAERAHSPQDVDHILGMPEATGALRLIWFHSTGTKKWTITTLVALVYLLVNTLGRLSVTSIGLAFDVNDSVEVKFPTMVTDWGSSEWFDVKSSSISGEDLDFPTEYFRTAVEKMQEFASLGMLLLGNTTDVKLDLIEAFDQIDKNRTDFKVSGLGVNIMDETVTYSYPLRSYQGTEELPSKDRVIESSSRCLPGSVVNGTLRQWGKNPTSVPKDIQQSSPDIVKAYHYFNSVVTRYMNGIPVDGDTFWFSRINWSTLANTTLDCLTSYILFRPSNAFAYNIPDNNETVIYECDTCLSGMHLLHNLPSSNRTYVHNFLLHYSQLNNGLYWPLDNALNENRIISYIGQLYQDPNFAAQTVKNAVTFLGDLPVMPQSEELYRALLSLDGPDNEDGVRTKRFALNAAHQAARTSLLPLIGAERLLPVVNEVPGQVTESIVVIELEVDWFWVSVILGSILVGTLAAVVGAVLACRGVPMQDPQSVLTVSCLLRGALAVVDVGGWSGVMLRYGARLVEGVYEVGLWVVEGEEGGIVEGFPEGQYRVDEWADASGVDVNGDEQEEIRSRTRRDEEDDLRSPDPMMGGRHR